MFDLSSIDGILFAEILWYVLDDIDNVLSTIKAKYNGYLLVNQVFYKGGQKYGREYFTNQDEMIQYFGMKPIVKCRYEVAENESAYETHTVFRL